MSKKKKVEPLCKNCRLYDAHRGECRVVILLGGRRVNLPVDPNDRCFFEQTYTDPKTGQKETFNEVKQVRFWVEDEKGQPTDGNGKVKIEYPDGFFSERTIGNILG